MSSRQDQAIDAFLTMLVIPQKIVIFCSCDFYSLRFPLKPERLPERGASKVSRGDSHLRIFLRITLIWTPWDDPRLSYL